MGSVFAHKDDSLNRKTPPPPHSRDLRTNFGLTKRRFSTVSRRNTSHRRFTIQDPAKSSIVFQRRNYTPLPSTTHAGILFVQFSLSVPSRPSSCIVCPSNGDKFVGIECHSKSIAKPQLLYRRPSVRIVTRVFTYNVAPIRPISIVEIEGKALAFVNISDSSRGRGARERLVPIPRSETNGRLKGRGARKTLVSRGRRGMRDKLSRVPDLKSIFLFLQPVNTQARTRSANCVKLPAVLNSTQQNLRNENFHSLGIQLTCNSPASSSEPCPLNRHYVIIEFHAAAVIAAASAPIETSNIDDGSVGRGQPFSGFATPVSAGTQQQTRRLQ
ncbi:hypothetical protein WN51_06988 [Melipona quadrifasciata]|uniref:Uncharacterized protein n=1 Tax=Melipona quadrifasciata TaxID=166423 RepID=A0A0M8ZQ40_9HYME|nr:hypothetical protein WN51_06988 [Melipona quadrifasciata]